MFRKSLGISLLIGAAAVMASASFYANAHAGTPLSVPANWWQTQLPQLSNSTAPISPALAVALPPRSLAQYRGKPLVIHFWAPWCSHCIQEIETLTLLYKEYAPSGLQFIGIAVDSASHVLQFTQKTSVPYPVYIAGFGGIELARGFGNTRGGLPFTVILNQAGEIHYTALGRRSVAEFRQQFNNL
ncbi:TlpA disulfide reductase family protein [Mycoavidus sp. B2-EB]|uniref:TlpA family protein disulfide reductase n=1 Tax=Mycoavidus sp. B2-EB TaxID=2651972 RepID=UPI001623DE87|nr:TlpA disulfide reductase family protein [Mycoavidus sp. B2-EB]BBO60142.1 thioredoxin [Mycoavidus sp. B2-EB]